MDRRFVVPITVQFHSRFLHSRVQHCFRLMHFFTHKKIFIKNRKSLFALLPESLLFFCLSVMSFLRGGRTFASRQRWSACRRTAPTMRPSCRTCQVSTRFKEPELFEEQTFLFGQLLNCADEELQRCLRSESLYVHPRKSVRDDKPSSLVVHKGLSREARQQAAQAAAARALKQAAEEEAQEAEVHLAAHGVECCLLTQLSSFFSPSALLCTGLQALAHVIDSVGLFVGWLCVRVLTHIHHSGRYNKVSTGVRLTSHEGRLRRTMKEKATSMAHMEKSANSLCELSETLQLNTSRRHKALLRYSFGRTPPAHAASHVRALRWSPIFLSQSTLAGGQEGEGGEKTNPHNFLPPPTLKTEDKGRFTNKGISPVKRSGQKEVSLNRNNYSDSQIFFSLHFKKKRR